MHWKLTTYQNNRLLKTLAALLLLFSVSYGPVQENTAQQLFQSETLHFSKSKSLETKAISYKKAVRLGFFDSKKSSTFPDFTNHMAVHNARIKTQIAFRHKQFHSFKSDIRFFKLKTISGNPDEDLSIS